MTSQNPTEPDVKNLTIPDDGDAQAAVEQLDVNKGLSDEQIASIAGGNGGTTKTGLVNTGPGFQSTGHTGTDYP